MILEDTPVKIFKNVVFLLNFLVGQYVFAPGTAVPVTGTHVPSSGPDSGTCVPAPAPENNKEVEASLLVQECLPAS